MQKLIFNTTKKTVVIYDSIIDHEGEKLYEFENIPTVKVLDGFYEIIQEEIDKKYPILRVPISQTYMFIEK